MTTIKRLTDLKNKEKVGTPKYRQFNRALLSLKANNNINSSNIRIWLRKQKKQPTFTNIEKAKTSIARSVIIELRGLKSRKKLNWEQRDIQEVIDNIRSLHNL